MGFLAASAIVIATVLAMEWVAWASHKYIMHGWGWGWHRDHHEPHDNVLEKNDLFAVVFGTINAAMYIYGALYWDWLWWFGVGITLYGIIYTLVHDGLVHQRWPFRVVPKRGYLRRLYQAHRLHHAVEGRDDCVSFGFVYAPPVDDLKARLKASGVLAKRQSQHRDAWRADRAED